MSELRIDAKNDVQELSATDVDGVAGGAMMDLVMRVWTDANCLKRLTREGSVIDCSYPYRL